MRYIDLDKVIEDVESVGAYYSEQEAVKELCLDEIKGQPIADVVPREEVAKQIFEEIEKEIKEAMNFVKQNYAETENALWQAQYVGLNQARYIVLDAKKKYIKIQ
jgi:hypothetical protein